MANASAKRIASQNEQTVRLLKYSLIVPTLLSILLRFLLRRSSLPPSKGVLALYVTTYLPALFLTQYLIKVGTTKRDSVTGALISSGEDLNQPGVTEWCLDVIYVTWICQIGSGVFGEWFWWCYLVIPLYAVYKLWHSVVAPFFLGRSENANTQQGVEPTSRRQEKLRKRGERGDARVRPH